MPVFAPPRFQQTVPLKYLSLILLGQPRYRKETFTLDVGACAPPDQLPLGSTTASDDTPAQDFQKAS